MNNQNSTEIFLFCIAGILIAFVLYVFITRYVHAITHRKQNEYAQTRLLTEIALELGVKESTVNAIIETANRM